MRPVGDPRFASNRQIKVWCPSCGYTLRTTRKWLNEMGTPWCPCNAMPMVCENYSAPMEEAEAGE